MEKVLDVEKEKEELAKMKQEIATNAGESTSGYQMMPQITVFNPNPNSKNVSEFVGGDLVMSTKKDSGYENKKLEIPFKANVIKVRMFLRTKKKFVDNGVPYYISDEFDSYDDNQMINIKEKIGEGYTNVFTGNYKEVNEKFAIKGEFNAEKYLELNHVMYVSFDLKKEELYKIVFKGTSRTKYFEYQKSFNRLENEFMSTGWTLFDSIEVKEDWQGNPLRFTVFAINFKKGKQLTLGELKKSLEIQKKLEMDFFNRSKLFNKTEIEGEKVEDPNGEKLPTIDIDKETQKELLESKENKTSDIPIIKGAEEDEDEIKLSDIPFS